MSRPPYTDPDILAGGDCVEKCNFLTKKPAPGQLRGPAVVQGRLAAKRLAGYDIEFPGVLDAGGCKMFDLTITATGFSRNVSKNILRNRTQDLFVTELVTVDI